MFAVPVIPGYIYRVKHHGTSTIVLACNGADAIVQILDLMGA